MTVNQVVAAIAACAVTVSLVFLTHRSVLAGAKPQPVGAVTIFRENNFSGASQTLGPGSYSADLGQLSIVGNDHTKSIKVPIGLSVGLFNTELNSDGQRTGGDPSQNLQPGDYPDLSGLEVAGKISFITVYPYSEFSINSGSFNGLTYGFNDNGKIPFQADVIIPDHFQPYVEWGPCNNNYASRYTFDSTTHKLHVEMAIYKNNPGLIFPDTTGSTVTVRYFLCPAPRDPSNPAKDSPNTLQGDHSSVQMPIPYSSQK